MKVPYAERAFVDMNKLIGYCLNPQHSRGRHKARVFAAALGLTAEAAAELRDALLAAVCSCESAPAEVDQYGQRYTVDFLLRRGRQAAKIRSAWIILHEEDYPKLISCYVMREQDDEAT
ncbi:DUF6883 domain-containing protein [Gloeobacter kilaueensis]|uniref:DUF6883 domain-containing protein n=1 Tax=Gloeobacter kilaueensis (strain ATCC BAA-2537 / CCAP 1431/1 / ULC 316 / JS1) TaxID=1183438 RepID=U5QK84_GLOK1|nr:DUF6883 domain-containing protein [Gloeobacter kilaueensis]AGY59372.1 hypothetical protein GKIL_3126 [Gloeobacter kilaueensis JS1]